MKAIEFGIVDTERRSPYTAMFTSSALFLLGSLPSVLPFVFIDSPGTGLAVAAVITALALFAVGAIKTVVTRTNPITSGAQNLIITGIGGIAAYFVGVLVDARIGWTALAGDSREDRPRTTRGRWAFAPVGSCWGTSGSAGSVS